MTGYNEAEQHLMGAILMYPDRVLPLVEEIMQPVYFSDGILAGLYAYALKIWNEGGKPSVFAVRRFLENRPELAGADIGKFAGQLVAAAVGANEINIEFARIIRDAWLRRSLSEIAQETVEICDCPGDKSADAIAEQIEERLLQISQSSGETAPNISAFNAIIEAFDSAVASSERGEALEGISWGYHGLDDLTGGLTGGNLYLIGARPGMGKTALGLGVASRIAGAGNRTLFWSGEMPARQLGARLGAARAGIDLRAARTGMNEGRDLSDAQWDGFQNACDQSRKMPLEIDTRSGITVSQLRSRARRMKRSREGLAAIVIDYVGLMQPSPQIRGRGLYEAMTEISKGLKSLAKELDVPIIALAQLSRQVEQRPDKKPIMSDLRDSGGLEQDADVIGLLYRAEYYIRKELNEGQGPNEKKAEWEHRLSDLEYRLNATTGLADLFIVKNRHGREGTVKLSFDAPTTWFRDQSETKTSRAWG